jgi:hypothetical protein
MDIFQFQASLTNISGGTVVVLGSGFGIFG